MSTPTKLFEPYKLGPAHPAQSPCHGALDPQPRDPARHGAEPAGDRILRPARLGGPAGDRSEPGLAAGPGLSGHARHLFERTGRGLAQGDRPRARAQRAHLHPDLACRPHLAHLAAAERRRPGRALGDPRQGQDFRQQQLHRYLRAARAGACGNPGHHRGFQARHRQCAGSRVRRRRNPRRQRLPARPVCQGRQPTSAPTPMAARSRTAPN